MFNNTFIQVFINSFFSVIPESFRWLASHNKLEAANHVINKIAKINGREAPNTEKLFSEIKAEIEEEKQKNYTVIDLFKNLDLTKKTFLISFTW